MSREITESEEVVELLASFSVSDEEMGLIVDCLRSVQADPGIGEPFTYSGYGGTYRAVECGRFLFIYQVSSQEIRVKDVKLTSRVV